MTRCTRRRFLSQTGRHAAAVLIANGLPRAIRATPLGKPVGIQLYTVKEEIGRDPAGTLRQLRRIGFGEVETAGFGQLSAGQFRRLLDEAGLACPRAHLQFDRAKLDSAFADAHALGAKYAASGSLRSLAAEPQSPAGAPQGGMSADEAKRTAELANRIGEQAARAGLQYVYHNHDFEFVAERGASVGYDLLLRETDPRLVKFEIDCGWMIFAGRDPVDYFGKYPNRFPMIHVKDFVRESEPAGATLGAMHGA
ncbi:MAG: sugar phosphate isomerase/epimerase, partial [Gammaproteobacteria bacterium]